MEKNKDTIRRSMKIGRTRKRLGWCSRVSSQGARGCLSSDAWEVEPHWDQRPLLAPVSSGFWRPGISPTRDPPHWREGSRAPGPEGFGQLDLASQRKIISQRKRMKYLKDDNIIIAVRSIVQVWGKRVTGAPGVRLTRLVLAPNNKGSGSSSSKVERTDSKDSGTSAATRGKRCCAWKKAS
jgi:hypothetical protein